MSVSPLAIRARYQKPHNPQTKEEPHGVKTFMVAADARASGKFERNTPTTNTCFTFHVSGCDRTFRTLKPFLVDALGPVFRPPSGASCHPTEFRRIPRENCIPKKNCIPRENFPEGLGEAREKHYHHKHPLQLSGIRVPGLRIRMF